MLSFTLSLLTSQPLYTLLSSTGGIVGGWVVMIKGICSQRLFRTESMKSTKRYWEKPKNSFLWTDLCVCVVTLVYCYTDFRQCSYLQYVWKLSFLSLLYIYIYIFLLYCRKDLTQDLVFFTLLFAVGCVGCCWSCTGLARDWSLSMEPASHDTVKNLLCLMLYTLSSRDANEQQGPSTSWRVKWEAKQRSQTQTEKLTRRCIGKINTAISLY